MKPDDALDLDFYLMDEASALEMMHWRYEAPYDIYNLEDDQDELAYALNPENRFYAFKDDAAGLVGFCSFGLDGQVPGGDYGLNALDIGMGIRPDLTGRGHGQALVSQVLDFAQKEFAPSHFRVTIAAFNQRAQRVWSQAGFQAVSRFSHEASGREFIILIRNNSV